MSKTYSDQVQKAEMLVTGLRKNFEQIQPFGISLEEIKRLETTAAEASQMNREVEVLREEVSRKAAAANKKLTEVKNSMQNLKQIIKHNFEQEKWVNFGMPDKR